MTDQGDDNPFRSRAPIETKAAIEILGTGEIDVLGQMPYSSNATFLVDLTIDDSVPAQAIYKPERCLLYTSPSPRDGLLSRMPSSA